MDAWTAAMARGDLQAAWMISDAVLAARSGPADDPRLPYHLRWVWDGRPFDGRHVLVRCYHGLGDTLQFIRFLPLLRARAASVTLEAQPELVPLLGGIRSVDRLVPFDVAHPLPPAECDLEIMELAHALRVEDLAPAPYLRLTGNTITAITGTCIIALCARAGNWDPERSIPLDLLLSVFPIPPLRAERPGEVGDITELRPIVLHPAPNNPSDSLADIRTTAAILAAAPLVITVDTMIAHLAGALGRPTWLLLKAEPDWRWRQSGPFSHWYPRTRLFRQHRPADWSGPLAEISRRLSPPAVARAG